MWSDGAPLVRTRTALCLVGFLEAFLPSVTVTVSSSLSALLHSHLSPGPLLSLSPLWLVSPSCKARVLLVPLPACLNHQIPALPYPGIPQAPPSSSLRAFLLGLSFSPPPPLPLPSSMKTGTLGSLTATSCLGRTVWSWCGMTRASGVMFPATTTYPTPARWGLVRAAKGKGDWDCHL